MAMAIKRWLGFGGLFMTLGLLPGYATAAGPNSYIGMVNGGDIYVKSGADTSPWSMQLTSGMSASHLQMVGTRVAYIDGSGNLWLKLGLTSVWYLQTANVSQYALSDNGLLVLKNDNSVWYKAGQSPTGAWDGNVIATNASKVYLSHSQMVVIKNNGDLIGKVLSPLGGMGAAGPDGGWNLIAQGATSAAITDTRLVYIDASGNVRGKDGPIWYAWWNNGQIIDTTAVQVGLNGMVYCALFNRGGSNQLDCKPSSFDDEADFVFGSRVDSFSLAPNRFVVKGDNGDGGDYLRAMDYSQMTAFGGVGGIVTPGWTILSTTGSEATTNQQ